MENYFESARARQTRQRVAQCWRAIPPVSRDVINHRTVLETLCACLAGALCRAFLYRGLEVFRVFSNVRTIFCVSWAGASACSIESPPAEVAAEPHLPQRERAHLRARDLRPERAPRRREPARGARARDHLLSRR